MRVYISTITNYYLSGTSIYNYTIILVNFITKLRHPRFIQRFLMYIQLLEAKYNLANTLIKRLKSKEEKQQFISKYIDNIVIDKTDTGSLDIKQINFRSSFIDKVVKLTQVGAYDYKLPFEVNHKQEMVLVSSPMKRKQVNKYLDYLREYFEIEYREDKGDRTENGMTVFDSAIPDNYELLKVIPIIYINLFKGKNITFGLVFRPTIKEIINEK